MDPLDDKQPADLLDNTIYLVMDIGHLYRSIFDAKMTQMGLTRPEWWLVSHLCYFSGSTQQELADILDIDKGGLAKLLDRLEKKGIVQRQADPSDARQKRVYFAAKAKPLASKVDQASVRTAAESVSALKPSEIVVLHKLMRRLRETLLSQKHNKAFTTDKVRKAAGNRD